MGLTLDQIEPGVVAWLDSETLNRDSRSSPTWTVGIRPYVCIEVGPGTTTWLPLTRQQSNHPNREFHRLEVPVSVRFNGPASWRRGACYVRSVQHQVVARDVVILAAATAADTGCAASRARVASWFLHRLRACALGSVP